MAQSSSSAARCAFWSWILERTVKGQECSSGQFVYSRVGWAGLGQGVIEDSQEPGDVNWFGEVGLGAVSQETLNLAGHGIGTDDDHRDLAGSGIAPQLSENFMAIDVRKVHIQQEQVRLVLTSVGHAQPSLHGADQLDCRTVF